MTIQIVFCLQMLLLISYIRLDPAKTLNELIDDWMIAANVIYMKNIFALM